MARTHKPLTLWTDGYGGYSPSQMLEALVGGDGTPLEDSEVRSAIVATHGPLDTSLLPESGISDHNVREHGARGNGLTDDFTAFTSAIEAAVAERDADVGLARVRVPLGKYLIGTSLTVPAGVVFDLEPGATFVGAGAPSVPVSADELIRGPDSAERNLIVPKGDFPGLSIRAGVASPAQPLLSLQNFAGTPVITASHAGAMALSNGTATAPALAFISDPNTGMYRLGEDRLSFVTGGVVRATIQEDGALILPDTAAGDPANIGSGTAPGSLVLGHNRALRAINAARTGTLRLLNANTSNEISLGSGGTEGGPPTAIILRNTQTEFFGKQVVYDDFATPSAVYTIEATGAVLALGAHEIVRAGAGATAWSTRETSDTVARVLIENTGAIKWGPGNGAVDVRLSRSGPKLLATDSAIDFQKAAAADLIWATAVVPGDTFNRFLAYTDGKLLWGPGNAAGDTSLRRAGVGHLMADATILTASQFIAQPVTSGTGAFHARRPADADYRWFVLDDGQMYWGDGAGVRERGLWRPNAGTLQTDQNFWVGAGHNRWVTVATDTLAGSSASLSLDSGDTTTIDLRSQNSAAEARRARIINTSNKLYIQQVNDAYTAAATALEVDLATRRVNFPVGIDVAGVDASVPAGTILPTARITAAPGYLMCDGAAVVRATYPALFNAITIQRTGNTTNASNQITGLSATADLAIGWPVSGSGIPAGATIASIVNATTITISVNATATATAAALVFAPYGVGDGTTTFNVPDMRGRVPVGVDGAAARLDALDVLGQAGGVQKHALTPAETAEKAHQHSFSGTTGGRSAAHTHDFSQGHGGVVQHSFVVTNMFLTNSSPFSEHVRFGANSTGGESVDHTHGYSGTTTGGPGVANGAAHSIMQPYQVVNYMVKT